MAGTDLRSVNTAETAANAFLILADAVQGAFAPIEAVAMSTEEWERGDSLIAAFARKGEVLYAA